VRTRFAPSPTGRLHLGHVFSALTAWEIAQEAGGEFLLRIEDADAARCRSEFEAAIRDDLAWLGIAWPEPALRQSERLPRYAAMLERLTGMGLTYPCRCTRADIRAGLSAPQEGAAAVVYPGTCRGRLLADVGASEAVRLNLDRALEQVTAEALGFEETGPAHRGWHRLDAGLLGGRIGDVVLGRKDIGTAAYHLAVVVDDAEQGVTDVVRGEDLWEATPLHRLLQALLGLPTPVYHHHRLIRDAEGRRLAKRDDARAIARYREDGLTAAQVRALVGL